MQSEFSDRSSPPAAPRSGAGDGTIFNSSQEPSVRSELESQALPKLVTEALVSVIGRLAKTLDLETAMLEGPGPIALHPFNHMKSQGLLELSRTMDAMRDVNRSAFDLGAEAPLAALRVKLEANLAILQRHVNAVAEIAAIIARAIQDHESDGTYTAAASVEGRRR